MVLQQVAPRVDCLSTRQSISSPCTLQAGPVAHLMPWPSALPRSAQIRAHPWAKVFSKRMPADAVDLVGARRFCGGGWAGEQL